MSAELNLDELEAEAQKAAESGWPVWFRSDVLLCLIHRVRELEAALEPFGRIAAMELMLKPPTEPGDSVMIAFRHIQNAAALISSAKPVSPPIRDGLK